MLQRTVFILSSCCRSACPYGMTVYSSLINLDSSEERSPEDDNSQASCIALSFFGPADLLFTPLPCRPYRETQYSLQTSSPHPCCLINRSHFRECHILA